MAVDGYEWLFMAIYSFSIRNKLGLIVINFQNYSNQITRNFVQKEALSKTQKPSTFERAFPTRSKTFVLRMHQI